MAKSALKFIVLVCVHKYLVYLFPKFVKIFRQGMFPSRVFLLKLYLRVKHGSEEITNVTELTVTNISEIVAAQLEKVHLKSTISSVSDTQRHCFRNACFN
jgi:hypothetical protein